MADYRYNPAAGAIAGQSGTFTLDIRFTKPAINNFHQIVGALRTVKDDLAPLWEQVADIIAGGIFEQLVFGYTPDNEQWEALSPDYARRVHRTRMYIPQTSPIFDAYVWHPLVTSTLTQLRYAPSGIPELHWLALQSGFKAGKTTVPGREWFGISDRTEEQIDTALALFIEEQISAVGGNLGRETPGKSLSMNRYLAKLRALSGVGSGRRKSSGVSGSKGWVSSADYDTNVDYEYAYP